MTLAIFSRSFAGILVVGAATSAMAQSATQTRLLSLDNPSVAGASVRLRAEIDGLGGGAPTGWVTFWDGTTRIGWKKLGSPPGAGQATLESGYAHSCAMTAASGVKCWGMNSDGQLGDGTRKDRLAPVDVVGLASGVVGIATGDHHSCALTAAGGVKCWGYNFYGELGDGTRTTRLTPVAVAGLTSGVVAIAAGWSHSCALTAAGGIKCWGRNDDGQLGDGTTTQTLTPVAVIGLTSGVVAIAAGWTHSCALTAAGGVKCWGDNGYGEVGDGTTTHRPTPVAVTGLTSGGVAIAAGWSHSCALTESGGVKCWGYNVSGQLGDGTTTQRLTPVAVTGLSSGGVAIAMGTLHSCALTGSGGAKCWGRNNYGQLGDGTTRNRRVPVVVTGLSSGGVAITACDAHSCALTGAGGVKCWGANYRGQLGDGTTTQRLMPVDTQSFSGLMRVRAEFTTPPLTIGTHWLRAFYRGDATHGPSHGGMRQWVR